MKKKMLWSLLIVAAAYFTWCKTYTFDADKAAAYAEAHHYRTSHHVCAWYVMRAMQSGGCPIGILPAWAYKYVMPFYGFEQVQEGAGNHTGGYRPQRGDVVVIENGEHSFWGHIALYSGGSWVSDFRQRAMNPYRGSVAYVIFRNKTL